MEQGTAAMQSSFHCTSDQYVPPEGNLRAVGVVQVRHFSLPLTCSFLTDSVAFLLSYTRSSNR